jgi:hypothetical protein
MNRKLAAKLATVLFLTSIIAPNMALAAGGGGGAGRAGGAGAGGGGGAAGGGGAPGAGPVRPAHLRE